jgi:hypothetical protein
MKKLVEIPWYFSIVDAHHSVWNHISSFNNFDQPLSQYVQVWKLNPVQLASDSKGNVVGGFLQQLVSK